MTKITGPAKVIQFTGNSSLGGILNEKSVAPGGPLHYAFQTEPPEFQRSGSTANGVIKLMNEALKPAPKKSVILVANDLGGQYLTAHYIKALEANGQHGRARLLPAGHERLQRRCLPASRACIRIFVHIWYNPDETLVALPQAIQLNVARSYFVMGVDPGVWKARQLKAAQPVVDQLHRALLGPAAVGEGR